MLQAGFDPKMYRDDPPLGAWEAKLDQLVYSKSSKIGIHVYLTDQAGERFWFFARWLGGSPVHFFFKENVQPGDQIMVEVHQSKRSGKPYIKSVAKV